ncbi:MAG: CPBP family intramembrane metalloprotease [Planctomycetes bacterium]|nr:CPBP family intramembrane metalloprotease [Planctomycetota bacterium]
MSEVGRAVRQNPLHEPWRRFVPVLWLMALLTGSSIVGAIYLRVSGDESPWFEVAVTAFDALVIVAFALRERALVRAALSFDRVTGRGWLYCLAVFGVMVVVVEAYFWLGQFLFDMIDMLESYRAAGWPPWSAVVLIVLCPAFFEELAFRGFLLERLQPLMGRRDALLLQAALFSILHLSPAILPSHFCIGLGLGLMRQRTGSLVPGMFAHGLWNLIVLVEEGLLTGW